MILRVLNQDSVKGGSMKVFALFAILITAGVFMFTNSVSVHAQTPSKQSEQTFVRVKQGDTLTKIAKKYKTTYTRLFYANKSIKHPDMIFPKEKIRIPNKSEKLKKRSLPSNSSPSTRAMIKENEASPVHKQSTAPNVSNGSVWDKLAACESGGNWSINTGNGYYGGLQFSLSSWRGVGGAGYPHQASKSEQILRAERLKASGGWGHWPACSAKLGLL